MKIFHFLFKKIPDNLPFKNGQKVMCGSCYQCLDVIHPGHIIKWIDFKPAWIKPNDCNWFRVKLETGKILNLPECVIRDYQIAIDCMKSLLERSKDKIGSSGFSIESYNKLSSIVDPAHVAFLGHELNSK